jgi:membrane protease YdiL (CAAX protease family)
MATPNCKGDMATLTGAPRTDILDPSGSAKQSRGREWIALLLGSVLWLVAVAVAHLLPQIAFGLRLHGWVYGLVGVIQALLAPIAITVALRVVGRRLRDGGLTTNHWRSDTIIGAAVAIVFAILQFTLIIPLTGGAQRSDVAMALAQIGGSLSGVAGFIVLAWTGGFSEELFFRGHLLPTLQRVLGGRYRTLISVGVTTAVFALMHGYQGWSGMVDTGLYGGITLSLLYVWRQRLTACLVAHALWNTIAVVTLYVLY